MKFKEYKERTAIITGVGGQDGFYLSHYLLGLGYKVVGIQRRTSLPNDQRLRTLEGSPNFYVVDGDITDFSSLVSTISKFQPDEFYNLAAQSHVQVSWTSPIATAEITGMGVLNCLEAIKQTKPNCKFYQAGSSEQFGNVIPKDADFFIPLNEESEMNPESPYAASKVFGYNMVKVYRKSYSEMFCCTGVLFNHGSPLRGEEFVTRKVTKALARIKHGLQDHVELGNLDSYRDWSFAGDMVRGMHMMLQQNEAKDYVLSSGETHKVREFVELACKYFDLNIDEVVKINPKFFRPSELNVLLGDCSRAISELGWDNETSFGQFVNMMCEYDYHAQSINPAIYSKADQFLGV